MYSKAKFQLFRLEGNYLFEQLSDIFGDFLRNAPSIFSDTYNQITPQGRPE